MSHISGKVPVIISNPYENLIIDELPPRPRNNKITHCYSSKYFWFAICHCILFLLLVVIVLIVCNHLGYTPVIFQFFQAFRASEQHNGIDKDPCPSGYILFEETNSCYKAIPTAKLFEDAISDCQVDGAHLTSIHSETENIFIVGLFHESDIERRIPNLHLVSTKWTFWIGMIRSNGTWIWLDGSPVNYRNYASRKETSNIDNHHTAIYATGYKWRGVSGEKRGFVCKQPSNIISNAKKTSTKKPCPSGYTWFQSTENCYKAFGNRTSFEKAKETCQNDFAKLTSVHSKLESIFLRGLVMKCREDDSLGQMDIWIGLTHKNHEFHWIDRTDVDYEDWSTGEPNSSDGYDATIMAYWGRWKSAKSSTENGFICKMY